jgi:hypothetical protein
MTDAGAEWAGTDGNGKGTKICRHVDSVYLPVDELRHPLSVARLEIQYVPKRNYSSNGELTANTDRVP